MNLNPSRTSRRNEASHPDRDRPTSPNHYLFYSGQRVDIGAELAPMYRCQTWGPSLRHPWPGLCGGKAKLRFLFRSILHYLHLFAGRECGAVCIYFGARLVHYSGFTPRYWRFPFLSDEELQIGDTWTDPEHRRKGLALFALKQIVQMKGKPGRNFWYVVDAANQPSISAIEKAGFIMLGEGSWIRPFGIKALGSYVLNDRAPREARSAELPALEKQDATSRMTARVTPVATAALSACVVERPPVEAPENGPRPERRHES